MNTSSQLHDAYAADYDSQVSAYDCYIAEVLFGLCYEFIHPGQKLFDLGIGSGLSALLFAKAGLKVYGMDFSPAMLENCRTKGIAVELKQHDVQAIPWPYSSHAFEHVICCGVLHFIPELGNVFRETGRILQDGGLFAFTTKTPTSLLAPSQNYDRQIADGLDVFSHSSEYVEALIRQMGFNRTRVLRCFIGQDIFHVWVTQKTKGAMHEP